MDLDEKIKERKIKGEIQDSILEIMGEVLKDSRFNSIAKLSKMEKGLMNLTLENVENKNKAMSDEIEKLVNDTYQRFNAILRNYNKEEI